MKRVLVLLLSFVLTILFVGCGENQTDTNSKTKSQKTDSIELFTERTTDYTSVDINWKKEVLAFTDSEGYKYKVEYKISPWILLSNTDAINSAWSEIEQTYTLPGFDDWSLKLSNGTYYSDEGTNFYAKMNDMYYCMGTMKIKNSTPGWNIDSTRPRNVKFGLGIKNKSSYYSDDSTTRISTLGRTFKTEEENFLREYVNAEIEMTDNESELIPFILMAPENFTPNNPKGEYRPLLKNRPVTLFNNQFDSYSYDTDKNVNLDLIGKNNK